MLTNGVGVFIVCKKGVGGRGSVRAVEAGNAKDGSRLGRSLALPSAARRELFRLGDFEQYLTLLVPEQT